MSDPNRIAGVLEIEYSGNVIKVVGNVSYNIGSPKREGLVGPDSPHGYSELPQIPFIEGEARLITGVSLTDLTNVTNATITLTTATNVTIMLSDAWYANEGTAGTEAGSVPFRFEALAGEEIGA